ncbi:hypothetical protein HN451_01165, partial [archaeon]|nr:hypothetical protein [archaeon]
MRKKILIKSKKAEGGLVEIILLVLLALASIVILWKISYFMILEGSESPEKTICITTEFNIKKINDLTFNIKRIFGNKEFNTVEFIINTD